MTKIALLLLSSPHRMGSLSSLLLCLPINKGIKVNMIFGINALVVEKSERRFNKPLLNYKMWKWWCFYSSFYFMIYQ